MARKLRPLHACNRREWLSIGKIAYCIDVWHVCTTVLINLLPTKLLVFLGNADPGALHPKHMLPTMQHTDNKASQTLIIQHIAAGVSRSNGLP